MGRVCGTYGQKADACRILVGKPGGRRPLGRPRRRLANNIKIELTNIVWTGLIWLRIGTRSRALVNTVMNFRVP
jgi:hypothetical protein